MAINLSSQTKLLALLPCTNDQDQIICTTASFNYAELPPFTVLYGPPHWAHLGQIEISLDDESKEISVSLALALKRLRYIQDMRYISLQNVSGTDSILDLLNGAAQELNSQAQFYAFWASETSTISSIGESMGTFHVVLPEHKERFLLNDKVNSQGISTLLLLPAEKTTNGIETKTITIPTDDPPTYTLLTPCHNYENDVKTLVTVDGAPSMISRDIADAFRLLRHKDSFRYIISEAFQRDAKQIARYQFELRKSGSDFAFWRYPESCGWTEPSPNNMDHFIILPNRYIDTRKFYTTLDYSSDSQEIRLLVLPPLNSTKDKILRCRFQNVVLGDPTRPKYELFHVAGPAKPRNGREELYKYDVELNGYISVVSDGIRVGLLELQHETEERLVFNSEVCYNCRDATEVQHFGRLNQEILRGAAAGNVLLYDFLSSMTPSLNRNSNFKYPAVDPNLPEIRLIEFLPAKENEINCCLVISNLDNFPSFKSLSYTWGSTRSMALHRTIFGPEDNLDSWPIVKNNSSQTKTLELYKGLTEFININGSRFLITKHLGAALRCLRDKGDSQYYWVDAICINQSDRADRSSQVQMMGRIYSSAEQVLAYLGDSDEEAEALSLINMIGSEEFDWEEFHTWKEYLSNADSNKIDIPSTQTTNSGLFSDDREYKRLLSALQDPKFAKSMQTFVTLEWWTRLWVYQEATLPHSLIIHRGTSRVDFENLFRAVTALTMTVHSGMFESNPLGENNQAYANLMSLRMERRRRHTPGIEAWYGPLPNQFLFYLEALGSKAASDPRDVVYAAIGLTESYPKKIIPDYSKTIENVWTSAARELIKRDQDLTILSLCEGVMTTAAGWAEYRIDISDPTVTKGQDPLPSWVPYWGHHREGMGAKRLRHDWISVPEFRACGEYATVGAKFSKDGRILFSKGVLLDVVKEVVPGYQRLDRYDTPNPTNQQEDQESSGLNYHMWHETFKSWEQAIIRIAPRNPEYVLGGMKVDALMHSLHAPFILERLTLMNQDIDTDGALPELYDTDIKPSLSQVEKPINLEPSPLATRLWQRESKSHLGGITTLTSGHELVITEKGYIGIGMPKVGEFGGVHVGDLVVVLCGGSVPFFLRQVGAKDRYLLAGDAYLHGLMYGAAMQNLRDEDMIKFPII